VTFHQNERELRHGAATGTQRPQDRANGIRRNRVPQEDPRYKALFIQWHDDLLFLQSDAVGGTMRKQKARSDAFNLEPKTAEQFVLAAVSRSSTKED
jgi:hypothetical protein